MEAILLQPYQRSPCQVAMAYSEKFVEVRSSRRYPTKTSAIAVQQPCPVAKLPHLRLVLVVALLVVVMPKVDWPVHWLVPWQRGRARCRILVSASMALHFHLNIRLTVTADDEKDDDDW